MFGCYCKNQPYQIDYQGVTEFHILARIGCYCKIMVFSPFKLEVTYYHSSKGKKIMMHPMTIYFSL